MTERAIDRALGELRALPGETVRINTQLIDVKTGHHLWAEKFDRDLQEVFKLQDQITKTCLFHKKFTLNSVYLAGKNHCPQKKAELFPIMRRSFFSPRGNCGVGELGSWGEKSRLLAKLVKITI